MGVALVADPPHLLRFLPPLDRGFLSLARPSSGTLRIPPHSLPSIRCFAPSLQIEEKKDANAELMLHRLLQQQKKPAVDLMVQQTPKSAGSSRSRTLKRTAKKASGKKVSAGAQQKSSLDYDESTVAALEQLYLGSPSFGSAVPLPEDEIATVSGSPSLENDSSSNDRTLHSADHFFQSERGKGSSTGTVSNLSEEVPKYSSKNGRRRKDLTARITSRRKQPAHDQVDVEAPAVSFRTGDFGKDRSKIMSSARVHELVRQYGGNFNLMAQSWFKLHSELLTGEEEQWLGSLMKPFKALQRLELLLQKRLSRGPTLEEWAQAAKMDLHSLREFIDVGRAARNKLVQLNLRLVLHQARKYYWEGCSLSVSDLCQEGVQGLMIAVDKFEPSKGFKFCTYAVYWIRNSILRAQTRSGYPVRSPFNVAELKLHIRKMSLELLLELGRAPTAKEVMDRVGIDKLRYTMVMRTGRRWTSLHEKQKVTGRELIENLNDQNEDIQRKLGGGAGDAMLRLGIDDVLDSLKPKESLVLRQRFGLDGKGQRSLGEIGRNLRMSREMARKYEARGLLKLKHPTRLAYLRSFLPSVQSSSV